MVLKPRSKALSLGVASPKRTQLLPQHLDMPAGSDALSLLKATFFSGQQLMQMLTSACRLSPNGIHLGKAETWRKREHKVGRSAVTYLLQDMNTKQLWPPTTGCKHSQHSFQQAALTGLCYQERKSKRGREENKEAIKVGGGHTGNFWGRVRGRTMGQL